MNGHWTLAHGLTWCGAGDGHRVPAGEPVYAMTGRKFRCQAHAPAHALEDVEAIERVCVAAEADRAISAAAAELPAPTRQPRRVVAPPSRPHPSRTARVSTRTAQPFATVAHVPDPKAQAFND